MDEDLRNRLWNIINVGVFDKLEKYKSGHYITTRGTEFYSFCGSLWHNFYKLTIDSIPEKADRIENYIRD